MLLLSGNTSFSPRSHDNSTHAELDDGFLDFSQFVSSILFSVWLSTQFTSLVLSPGPQLDEHWDQSLTCHFPHCLSVTHSCLWWGMVITLQCLFSTCIPPLEHQYFLSFRPRPHETLQGDHSPVSQIGHGPRLHSFEFRVLFLVPHFSSWISLPLWRCWHFTFLVCLPMPQVLLQGPHSPKDHCTPSQSPSQGTEDSGLLVVSSFRQYVSRTVAMLLSCIILWHLWVMFWYPNPQGSLHSPLDATLHSNLQWWLHLFLTMSGLGRNLHFDASTSFSSPSIISMQTGMLFFLPK